MSVRTAAGGGSALGMAAAHDTMGVPLDWLALILIVLLLAALAVANRFFPESTTT